MALYLPGHNALYVHCPGTGGGWVRRALAALPGLDLHEVGHRYAHKDLVGPLTRHDRPLIFATVRHPVSWYASYWRSRGAWSADDLTGQGAGAARWHPVWPLDSRVNACDFAAFVEQATTCPGFVYDMFRWYSGLGTSHQADLIGKQETVAADLGHFLALAGVPHDPAALAAAGPPPASGGPDDVPWTDELRQLVLDAEQRCLLDYGYGPDGPLAGPIGRPAIRSGPTRLPPHVHSDWTPVVVDPPPPTPSPSESPPSPRPDPRSRKRRSRRLGMGSDKR